jgi:CheY-like chemotaxis protein
MNLITERAKNVLVVEDSADDVRLLERASRQTLAALAFHSVPSGEEAIAYLKGEGRFADRTAHPLPDLILLDVGLPGIGGLEVLTWIRNQSELKELKVFVWTDAGEPEVLERATQAGANRFVPKSVAFVRGGLAGLISGIAQAIADPGDQRERGCALAAAPPGARTSVPASLATRQRPVGRLPDARHTDASSNARIPGSAVQMRPAGKDLETT